MAMAHVALLCMLAGVALCYPVLLNAGGPQLPKIAWREDTGKYASAGSKSFTGGGPIAATGSWAPVYESHRWAPAGNLEYKIPVPDGKFRMALMFAETWADSGPGVRQMVVKINGAPVTQAGPGGLLDVFVKAGGLNKPVYLIVGEKKSQKGFITVTMERVAGKNNPMISGIALFGANARLLVGNEGMSGPRRCKVLLTLRYSRQGRSSDNTPPTSFAYIATLGGKKLGRYAAIHTGTSQRNPYWKTFTYKVQFSALMFPFEDGVQYLTLQPEHWHRFYSTGTWVDGRVAAKYQKGMCTKSCASGFHADHNTRVQVTCGDALLWSWHATCGVYSGGLSEVVTKPNICPYK